MVVKNIDLSGNRLKYLMDFSEKLSDTYGRKRRKLALGIHDLDRIDASEGLAYGASSEGRIMPLGGTKEMSFSEVMKENQKGVQYKNTIANRAGLVPFLSDSKNVLSVIPLTNSEITKVTGSTKSLLVDITGTDMKTVNDTANIFACSFMDMGAEVYGCEIDYGKGQVITPSPEYREIRMRLYKMEASLGINIDNAAAIGLGEKMGYPGAQYGNSVLFYVPPYRIDVLNEQDITEDIAISYGYNNIIPEPIFHPIAPSYPSQITKLRDFVANAALGHGFIEEVNQVLTNEETNFTSMGASKFDKDRIIRIAYSKTENATMLRTDVLPSLLKSLSISTSEPLPQKVFEVGETFSINSGRVFENISLAMATEHSKATFAEIKSVAESIMGSLGLEYAIKEGKNPSFIEGRCAAIEVSGETVGFFGEIHPAVLNNFKIEEPVAALELTLIKGIKSN
jgi:Phenylalanyl-tRNA synthetase beta subunit